MREKILTFIEKNSRIDLAELAVILGEDEAAVVNELEEMEEEEYEDGEPAAEAGASDGEALE